MSDATKKFLAQHGWHFVTALSTIVICLFSMGMTYQKFISKNERVEQLLTESQADRSEIHKALIAHNAKQADTELAINTKLAVISTDVTWLRDYFTKKTASLRDTFHGASN